MRNPLFPEPKLYPFREANVKRGGSWLDYAQFVRVSFRGYSDPTSAYSDLGFRLFRTQEKLK